MREKILWSFSFLMLIGACKVSDAAADNVSQQIQLLNSQIQTQLQKIQADQQTQLQALNTKLQAQIKKVQTELQNQIQTVNGQTQNQIRQVQTSLQQQIKGAPIQKAPAAAPISSTPQLPPPPAPNP